MYLWMLFESPMHFFDILTVPGVSEFAASFKNVSKKNRIIIANYNKLFSNMRDEIKTCIFYFSLSQILRPSGWLNWSRKILKCWKVCCLFHQIKKWILFYCHGPMWQMLSSIEEINNGLINCNVNLEKCGHFC